MTLEISDIKI